MCVLSSDKNNTPKTNAQIVNIGNTVEYDVK